MQPAASLKPFYAPRKMEESMVASWTCSLRAAARAIRRKGRRDDKAYLVDEVVGSATGFGKELESGQCWMHMSDMLMQPSHPNDRGSVDAANCACRFGLLARTPTTASHVVIGTPVPGEGSAQPGVEIAASGPNLGEHLTYLCPTWMCCTTSTARKALVTSLISASLAPCHPRCEKRME